MSSAPAGEGPGQAGAPRRRTGTVGVTIVCLLAGLLFGTSAALARSGPATTGATDLVSLITARDEQVKELAEEADDLRLQVQALQQTVDNSTARQLTRTADALAPSVGMGPVSGPAVQVTLDDAGYSLDTLPQGYSVDDVVVHQQDLQAVVNALWAGGAEAVMVMDQRIVSTSAVQCVGSTLYLQGRVYSPPYTITAIGDGERLHAALAADPTVTVYRQWAEVIGLGYAVQDLPEVEMPGFTGGVRPQHASIAELPQGSSDPTPSG